jgi:hypothetical protein
MRKQTIFSRKLALVLIANFVVSLPLHAETGNRDGRLLVKWKEGPESYAAAVGNAAIRQHRCIGTSTH